MRSIMERMIFVCEYDGTIEKDRERIMAWSLLEYAVRMEWGYSLKELDISRTEKGKPYSARYPEKRFNLSHCRVACACIVGHEECGIDVERKFPYRESLAKKVCHRDEWEILQIQGQDGNLRERQLQILWSLKEGYVKKDGRGLGYGMDRLSFAALMPFDASGVCPERGILWDCRENYTLAACFGPGESATAAPKTEAESFIRRVEEQELLRQEGGQTERIMEIRGTG